MRELRNFVLIGIPLGALLLLQWPFKAITEALERPIERLADRANKILDNKEMP